MTPTPKKSPSIKEAKNTHRRFVIEILKNGHPIHHHKIERRVREILIKFLEEFKKRILKRNRRIDLDWEINIKGIENKKGKVFFVDYFIKEEILALLREKCDIVNGVNLEGEENN